MKLFHKAVDAGVLMAHNERLKSGGPVGRPGLGGPGGAEVLKAGLDTAAGCCRMVGLVKVACRSWAAGFFDSLDGQFVRAPGPWVYPALRVAACRPRAAAAT